MTTSTTIVAAGDDYPNNYSQYNDDLVRRMAESLPVVPAARGLLDVASVLAVQNIDPFLDESKDCLDAAEDFIASTKEVPISYVFTETKERLSDKDAWKRVEHRNNLISAHQAADSSIDERAPGWLAKAGKYAPWAEVLGIGVFVTALWNVNLLRPWEDLLTFLTALVLTIGIPIIQKYVAESAGKEHNVARLAEYEGLDTQAHTHKVARNWYITATFVIATVSMVLLAVRGVMFMSAPSLWEIGMIWAMAAIVGYGTAVLAYAAKAVDGTRYMREVDELTSQGNAYAKKWQDDVASAEAEIRKSANNEGEIVNGKFPKVLEIMRQHPAGSSDDDIFHAPPLVDRAKRTLTLRSRREAVIGGLDDVKKNHRPAFLLNG